jgi:hypothetical protein
LSGETLVSAAYRLFSFRVETMDLFYHPVIGYEFVFWQGVGKRVGKRIGAFDIALGIYATVTII